MSPTADNVNAPWYRHLWVWLVMIPPASAVVAGFITAWLAGGPPALVVDDYSEISLATEQRQSRDRLASELGLSAQLKLPDTSTELAEVQVELDATRSGFQPPRQIQLQLIHPTREGLDQAVTLQQSGAVYHGSLSRPGSRVYVQLEDLDGQWRLVGELPDRATSLDLAAKSAP